VVRSTPGVPRPWQDPEVRSESFCLSTMPVGVLTFGSGSALPKISTHADPDLRAITRAIFYIRIALLTAGRIFLRRESGT
jgi:hypothetical protein